MTTDQARNLDRVQNEVHMLRQELNALQEKVRALECWRKFTKEDKEDRTNGD